MSSLPFDTLEFATELIASGLSDKHANAIAKAVNKAQQSSMTVVIEQVKHDYQLDDIANKRDIRELELKIELVKSELKRDIAETKSELIRWVVGVGLLQITIIAGLMFRLSDRI